MLRIEEQKREAVENLKQQQQEALTSYEQASAQKERTESELDKTQSELEEVKGRLKTEKFKSSAAEVGSNIVEGIGALVGTSKVKRQQQQIENLSGDNDRLRGEINGLNKTIMQQRQEHEQTVGKLQNEIDKIYDWFPDTPQLVKWGEYCKAIGFSDRMARDLVSMKPVYFSGRLYSQEYSSDFETQNSEARLVRNEKEPGHFRLLIDRIPIVQWFRQKFDEIRKRLVSAIVPQKQNRKIGIKQG